MQPNCNLLGAEHALTLLVVALLTTACEGRAGPDISKAVLGERPAVERQTSMETMQGYQPSSLWSLSEREPIQALASGDGVNTTASSATALLNGDQPQIYSGPRVAREDWAGLIARYKGDPSITAWVKGEQARVDAWIAKNFENPSRIGGWPMAFVDRATGIPLKWTADGPPPAVDPPGTPAKNSPYAAWVALTRDHNIAQILAAAQLFRLTGQQKYGDWAVQQLDFYADNYAKWPTSTYDGRSALYFSGLDESVTSFSLLNAARLLDEFAGAARRLRWDTQLFRPMSQNLKGTVSPLSNIDLWHQCARAAIGMRLHDAALINEALGPELGIAAITAANLSVDNFWAEGTFSYNNYVIEAMSRLLVFGSLQGYAEQLRPLSRQAARLLLAPIDYRFEDGSLPNPNDGLGQQDVLPERQHWMLYRVVPTYWGRARASAWRTWESLLDPPEPLAAKPPALPEVQTRNFPSVRHAVLRAGSWQAYVHYGATTGYHYQQEMSNFELNEGAQAISRDTGTVNYASPYHVEYFSQGAANNVPLIDGAGQAQWAQGTIDNFEPAQGLLAITQVRYQADASVSRKYRVTRSGFVEQSSITVPSGKLRRIGVIFNTRCLVLEINGAVPVAIPDPLPVVPAMARHFGDTKMWRADTEWTADLKCGQKAYTMTVRGPANHRVYLATVPDTPLPANRTALYYDVTGSKVSFETEIKAASSN